MEQFQNDFLAKLKSSIDQVQEQVHNLNKALRQAQFGTDKYQFRVGPNPDYLDYYNMITADELMEGESGLFALPFQQKYGPLIENCSARSQRPMIRSSMPANRANCRRISSAIQTSGRI